MKKFRLAYSLFLLLISIFNSTFLFAQWIQTNGPYGGVVRSFAVSGTNLFAGTFGGGVFLFTNNGASWTAVNTGLTNTQVIPLAVSGTNLFAGSWGDGVFLSTDNGTSWTADNTGLTNPYVFALAVSGTNLFAGTLNGVFISTNNGTSWTAVNTGLTNRDIKALAVSGTNLFAGTNGGGIFLSTNNGTSWTAVNTGLTYPSIQVLAVSGTNIFAGTNGGGIFLSTNNGTSWTEASTGLTNYDVEALAVSGTNIFAGTNGDGVWQRPISEMITSVQPLPGELPAAFRLEQNYPNPFNPSTTITFSISNEEFVSLKVFNSLGEEVAELVNEIKQSGNHSVIFNAEQLSSGIYIYKLSTGTFNESKKLLLLK